MAEPAIEARAAAVAFCNAWKAREWEAMAATIQISRRNFVASAFAGYEFRMRSWTPTEADPDPPQDRGPGTMAERLAATFGPKLLRSFSVLQTRMQSDALAVSHVALEYTIPELDDARFKSTMILNLIREDATGAASAAPAAGTWGANDVSALREEGRRPLRRLA